MVQLRANRGVIVGKTSGLSIFFIAATNSLVLVTDSSRVSLQEILENGEQTQGMYSHIEVGTIAIGANLSNQRSLTLTHCLLSQYQSRWQIVGCEIGGECRSRAQRCFLGGITLLAHSEDK